MNKHSLLVLALTLLLTNSAFSQEHTLNNGRKVFASPNFDEESKSLYASTDPYSETIANLATSSPALPIAETGIKKLTEQKFQDAQEAFKTSIRLEPMNAGLWQLYNEAVIGEYTTNKRNDFLKSAIEADLKPTFSITKIDSYLELGTLYIVGTVKNTSNKQRQKVILKARLLDANKKELRSEQGTLRSIDKVLYPNESSLFEISFKNPPSNIKSYRVEVASWE